MKFLKILFGLFVVSIGGLLLISVVFKDEIGAHTKQREEAAVKGTAEVTARLQKIRRAIASAQLEQKACPESMRNAKLDYLPTSMSQLALFDPSQASQAQQDIEWYRSQDLGPLAPRGPGEKADHFKVADAAKKVLKYRYLTVFVPVEQRWPKVVDRNTFDGGFFDGWAVIADFESQAIACQVRFAAESSASLDGGAAISIAKGLAEIPLSSMKSKAEEDFKTNFWRAAGAAIERARLDQFARQ